MFEAEPSDLRWSDRMWGTTDNWFAESGDASAQERGIFRVWSTTLAGGAFFFWLPEYPLTAEAQAHRDAFDPATRPPTSVWWQTEAEKASGSPST